MSAIHPDLVALATRLRRSVGRLEALLVPMSCGGMDSHGAPIGTSHELRDRLAESILAARADLVSAQEELTAMKVKD
jgi:hypothetical protein